jgi:hypothetical protein
MVLVPAEINTIHMRTIATLRQSDSLQFIHGSVSISFRTVALQQPIGSLKMPRDTVTKRPLTRGSLPNDGENFVHCGASSFFFAPIDALSTREIGNSQRALTGSCKRAGGTLFLTPLLLSRETRAATP